jgi:hypothetical protein
MWRLVDGVTSSQGAHTATQSNDWVMIDMQQTVFVDTVRIWNRVNCCQFRLNISRFALETREPLQAAVTPLVLQTSPRSQDLKTSSVF